MIRRVTQILQCGFFSLVDLCARVQTESRPHERYRSCGVMSTNACLPDLTTRMPDLIELNTSRKPSDHMVPSDQEYIMPYPTAMPAGAEVVRAR